MKNFRSYQLALQFFKDSRNLKLTGVLRNQFERASLSIVLNLGEGSAKPSRKDRRRFYDIALGSLRETQTILDIVGDKKLISQADVLGAHVYKLTRST